MSVRPDGVIHLFGIIGVSPNQICQIALDIKAMTTLILDDNYIVNHNGKTLIGDEKIMEYLDSAEWKGNIGDFSSDNPKFKYN